MHPIEQAWLQIHFVFLLKLFMPSIQIKALVSYDDFKVMECRICICIFQTYLMIYFQLHVDYKILI